jgi:hypothetical protein
MKKLFTILSLAFCLTVSAQQKDTTIAVTLSLNQFRALLSVIDANIDSKKASKELIEFLQANARIINPTTDWDKKAKEATKNK